MTEPMCSMLRETLLCLFLHGPTWDGDVPSKSMRDEAVKRGLAARGDGYQWLTEEGTRLCLREGMGREKEIWRSKRRKEKHALEAHNDELKRLLDAKVRIIQSDLARTGRFDG
jgi:hypothetical protein